MAISLGSDARYAQLPASRAGCTAATIPPYSLTFGQIVTGYVCGGLVAARKAALASSRPDQAACQWVIVRAKKWIPRALKSQRQNLRRPGSSAGFAPCRMRST
jgi:hypothetical protein